MSFLFQNIPKNLDPSFKMDLDFLNFFFLFEKKQQQKTTKKQTKKKKNNILTWITQEWFETILDILITPKIL